MSSSFSSPSSVTRWLLVVVGCAVLETAQPMKAADTAPESANSSSSSASGVIYASDPDLVLHPADRPDPSAPTAVTSAALPGAGWIFVALVAAVGGAVWAWRRHRPAGHAPRRAIQIEDTRALGNRQFLVVASCDGRRFLLGVAPGGIRLLSPLESDLPDDADDARPLP